MRLSLVRRGEVVSSRNAAECAMRIAEVSSRNRQKERF